MLNVKQFTQLVTNTLNGINLYSDSARNLLVGTALQESRLTYLWQEEGPALGIFQIEPATYHDICLRIEEKRDIQGLILTYTNLSHLPYDPIHLSGNMELSIIIARMKYYFIPRPLPQADDEVALAAFWSIYYQTSNIESEKENFINLYKEFYLPILQENQPVSN